MKDGDNLVTELAQKLSGKVVISSEITDSDIKGIGTEIISRKALEFFGKSQGLKVIDRETLKKIIGKPAPEEEQEKSPKVEVTGSISKKDTAKDVRADFTIKNAAIEKTPAGVEDFSAYFKNRFDKLRLLIERGRSAGGVSITNKIENLKVYANGRDIGVIGMVYEKTVTKNGHVMFSIEDETGTGKVLLIKAERTSRKEKHELFDFASKIVNDEVIAIKGRISSPFLIADGVIWPDIPIRQIKKTEDDIAIAFASDIHIGSKLFLDKQFEKFIEWLNGKIDVRKDIAEKIKYFVISGDLVDGIGVYPNQDKELSINDIYKQYDALFRYLNQIPEHIEVFVLGGNHDALQRAEPQPPLGDDLIKKDFKKDNIHLVSNPGYVKMHGINTLAYHGTSLDSVIQAIPGCSYSKPESAMIEVLKKRHVSPIYGDNPIMPSKKDSLVMDEVPDILHMGHLHKNGYADYHGTQVINSGTWQARTSYQVKLGHMPTPAILPIYHAKSGALWSMDFNSLA